MAQPTKFQSSSLCNAYSKQAEEMMKPPSPIILASYRFSKLWSNKRKPIVWVAGFIWILGCAGITPVSLHGPPQNMVNLSASSDIKTLGVQPEWPRAEKPLPFSVYFHRGISYKDNTVMSNDIGSGEPSFVFREIPYPPAILEVEDRFRGYFNSDANVTLGIGFAEDMAPQVFQNSTEVLQIGPSYVGYWRYNDTRTTLIGRTSTFSYEYVYTVKRASKSYGYLAARNSGGSVSTWSLYPYVDSKVIYRIPLVAQIGAAREDADLDIRSVWPNDQVIYEDQSSGEGGYLGTDVIDMVFPYQFGHSGFSTIPERLQTDRDLASLHHFGPADGNPQPGLALLAKQKLQMETGFAQAYERALIKILRRLIVEQESIINEVEAGKLRPSSLRKSE